MVSLNIKRRHLTQTQKTTVAIEMLPMLEEEAKERQRMAGKLYGENHPQELVPALVQALDQPSSTRAVRQAAAIMGVASGNVQEMKRIARVAPERVAELNGLFLAS